MKNDNIREDLNKDNQQQDGQSNTGKNNTVRSSASDNGEDEEIGDPETDDEILDDSNELDEEEDLGTTNESDLTEEDFQALGPRDLSMDGGEDEQLKQRTNPVDFTGDDLDVPGSELDDNSENIGTEDEENNHYSVGGDNHDDLEEDNTRTY